MLMSKTVAPLLDRIVPDHGVLAGDARAAHEHVDAAERVRVSLVAASTALPASVRSSLRR